LRRRGAGLGAVLGTVSLVTQQIWGIIAGQPIETDTPILGRTLYAGQIALFVVAVLGLYLHQRKAFGTFGQIATLAALFCTLLWSGSTASEALAAVDQAARQSRGVLRQGSSVSDTFEFIDAEYATSQSQNDSEQSPSIAKSVSGSRFPGPAITTGGTGRHRRPPGGARN
jgi:hypothetical protein